jgi:ABC-type multidrug transport system fused ATPase/permease subunit
VRELGLGSDKTDLYGVIESLSERHNWDPRPFPSYRMETPLLQLVNVSCSVENNQEIFDDLNLELNEGRLARLLFAVDWLTSYLPGDIVALRGRSGCGKSTLLKCISHLIPHEGVIKFRGKSVLLCTSYRSRSLFHLLQNCQRSRFVRVEHWKAHLTCVISRHP